MASIHLIRKELWDELKFILEDPAVVLVPEPVLEKFPEDKRAKLQEMIDNGEVNYDFGGEPDIYVDIILSEDSYAANELLGEEDDE